MDRAAIERVADRLVRALESESALNLDGLARDIKLRRAQRNAQHWRAIAIVEAFVLGALAFWAWL